MSEPYIYHAMRCGGVLNGRRVDYINQFLLLRGLLLGTITIDSVQAIRALDEIEKEMARLQKMERKSDDSES